jgi:hypothetical protein
MEGGREAAESGKRLWNADCELRISVAPTGLVRLPFNDPAHARMSWAEFFRPVGARGFCAGGAMEGGWRGGC